MHTIMFLLGFNLGQNGTLSIAVSLGFLAEIQKWYSVDTNQDNVERLRF